MKSYTAAWHYARFVEKSYRAALRPFKLNGRQAIILQALYDNDGLTQEELAAIVNMSATTVSQALRLLIDSDYVQRKGSTAPAAPRSTLHVTDAARVIEPEFRKRVQYTEQAIQSAVFDFFPIREAAKAS